MQLEFRYCLIRVGVVEGLVEWDRAWDKGWGSRGGWGDRIMGEEVVVVVASSQPINPGQHLVTKDLMVEGQGAAGRITGVGIMRETPGLMVG